MTRHSNWSNSSTWNEQCFSFIHPSGCGEEFILTLICISLVQITNDLEQLFMCWLVTITLLLKNVCSIFLKKDCLLMPPSVTHLLQLFFIFDTKSTVHIKSKRQRRKSIRSGSYLTTQHRPLSFLQLSKPWHPSHPTSPVSFTGVGQVPVAQSCLILCDPMDCIVHGIL